jgi:hypothetical protein
MGNVVMKLKIGNTEGFIYDDCYRDKTPEQIEEILDRVGQIVSEALYAKQIRSGEV